jgi:hypothetical protein
LNDRRKEGRSKIEKELAKKMVEDIMDFIDMSQKEYDGPSKIAALEFKRDQLKLSRVEFAQDQWKKVAGDVYAANDALRAAGLEE